MLQLWETMGLGVPLGPGQVLVALKLGSLRAYYWGSNLTTGSGDETTEFPPT